METNILAVLAWVAGPGLAYISARILEGLDDFQEISSNGKLVVSVVIAGGLGVLATAFSKALQADASLVAQLQPYADVIVPAVALLSQQLAHGKQVKAQRIEASRTPQDKAADTDFQP